MSFSEEPNVETARHAFDAVEERAMALVNPASGLANDFLNVYNEILMLIELLPAMPELADDIAAWRPASYRAYFMQSRLPGSDEALSKYAMLEPSFRAIFEASVEQLAEGGVAAVQAITEAVSFGAKDGGQQIADLCASCVAHLRRLLDSTEQMVNFGHVAEGGDLQAMVNELFSAA